MAKTFTQILKESSEKRGKGPVAHPPVMNLTRKVVQVEADLEKVFEHYNELTKTVNELTQALQKMKNECDNNQCTCKKETSTTPKRKTSVKKDEEKESKDDNS